QGGLLLALLDEAAGFGDQRGVFGLDRRAIRVAAPTRPEASCFGVFKTVMELDILRVGSARRARWPAIHARRRDRIPELTIGCPVARKTTDPSRIIRDREGRWLLHFLGRCVHRLLASTTSAMLPPDSRKRAPILAFKSAVGGLDKSRTGAGLGSVSRAPACS